MTRNEARDVQTLHRGAIKAFKKAVAKALAQHRAAGVPAAIWRNGKVVYLPARQPKGRRGRR